MLERDDWRILFAYEVRRLRDLHAHPTPRGGLRPGSGRRFRRTWFFLALSAALHAGLLTSFYFVTVSEPIEEAVEAHLVTIRLLPRPVVKEKAPEPPPPDEPEPPPPAPEPQRSSEDERPRNPTPTPVTAEPPPADAPEAAIGVGPGPERVPRPFGWTRGEGKASALAVHGGDGVSEAAVAKGLEWLARHQDESGFWDPAGFDRHCVDRPRCDGEGLAACREGTTALALLAFLGARGDLPDSPYAIVTRRAIGALRASQSPDGCVGPKLDHYMYNHAIGALAFAEAVALGGHENLREPATRAIRYSARAQQPGGGWDYTEEMTGRDDLSVTGWQVMALAAAHTAGIDVPDGMVRSLGAYLARVADANGIAVYAESGLGAGRKGISMVAVALVARLLSGWRVDHPAILAAADRVAREVPGTHSPADWEKTFHSSYMWYYGTLGLFHLGGSRWETWNRALRAELLRTQVRKGEARGSWDPEPNWISTYGGRVYATAINVLTLQVYYRYEPLARNGA
ncbi:MAG: terpene cyclase/mutase family protein [Planctomycetes bacterium]|nr:terpene cyclase/mutase family protein [Planctomycetota bacterium]